MSFAGCNFGGGSGNGGGGGSGNTTTDSVTITCDGNEQYTVTNPLNNPDVEVLVRYNTSSPYQIVQVPVTISASQAVVDLSSQDITPGTTYKVIFSGIQL
jgi:hypothetical protein